MQTTAPMAPWNSGVRFVIEIAIVVGLAALGRTLGDTTPLRWIYGTTVVLAGMALWAVFRVPGDPGDARVPVPGRVRLAIELVLAVGAAVGLAEAFPSWVWITFTVAVLVHNAAAIGRIRWLLAR